MTLNEYYLNKNIKIYQNNIENCEYFIKLLDKVININNKVKILIQEINSYINKINLDISNTNYNSKIFLKNMINDKISQINKLYSVTNNGEILFDEINDQCNVITNRTSFSKKIFNNDICNNYTLSFDRICLQFDDTNNKIIYKDDIYDGELDFNDTGSNLLITISNQSQTFTEISEENIDINIKKNSNKLVFYKSMIKNMEKLLEINKKNLNNLAN